MTCRFLSSLLLATALAAPVTATAQSKKELADTDARLAQRIDVLERRFLTGDPAAQRLMQRVDALDVAVRALTGEIEQLTYQREQLRGDVKALADDLRAMQELETRMRIHLDAVDLVAAEQAGRAAAAPVALPGSPSLNSVPDAPTLVSVPNPAQAEASAVAALPATGRTRMAEGDFLGAQSAFRDYLDQTPDAPDAGEIRFLLGETYFVRGGYADAADSYIASMRADAQGPRAAEAMVRLGSSLRELGKTAEACQTLRSVPTQYPNAPAELKTRARDELALGGC